MLKAGRIILRNIRQSKQSCVTFAESNDKCSYLRRVRKGGEEGEESEKGQGGERGRGEREGGRNQAFVR